MVKNIALYAIFTSLQEKKKKKNHFKNNFKNSVSVHASYLD